MEITCCSCGIKQPISKAIEAEEERKEMELEEGLPVPTIGIVCEACKKNYTIGKVIV